MSDCPSHFRTIVEAIRLKLIEIQARDKLSQPLSVSEDDRQWLVGRDEIVGHRSQPYVGWARGGGEIVPPRSLGAIEDSLTKIRLTPLYDADTTIVCVIVAPTERATEALWFDVLRAAHEVLGASAKPGSYRWPTQEDEKLFGLSLDGAQCVIQNFLWPLIVPRDIRRTVVVQTVTHDDRFGTPPTMTTEEH
jgi:hypothetical protein